MTFLQFLLGERWSQCGFRVVQREDGQYGKSSIFGFKRISSVCFIWRPLVMGYMVRESTVYEAKAARVVVGVAHLGG